MHANRGFGSRTTPWLSALGGAVLLVGALAAIGQPSGQAGPAGPLPAPPPTPITVTLDAIADTYVDQRQPDHQLRDQLQRRTWRSNASPQARVDARPVRPLVDSRRRRHGADGHLRDEPGVGERARRSCR